MKNRILAVQGAEVSVTTRHDQDYISLTDMVRNFDGGGALIEQWLKNKDTVLFLGVWELLNNTDFNSLEFEGIKNEAGRNSFFLSAKKWIANTGAIGLHGARCQHRCVAVSMLQERPSAHGGATRGPSALARARPRHSAVTVPGAAMTAPVLLKKTNNEPAQRRPQQQHAPLGATPACCMPPWPRRWRNSGSNGADKARLRTHIHCTRRKSSP